MGSLGPTHLIAPFLAVAIIAAICGFIASAVVWTNKRRARGFFVLGFFCGWTAGSILCGRRLRPNRARSRAPLRCVDGINMPQAYAVCCWAAKSRGMARLTARGIPN
jgi:hypothetical protein